MPSLIAFLRKERLSLLLLIFVILVQTMIVTYSDAGKRRAKPAADAPALSGVEGKGAEVVPDREGLERLFAANPVLAVTFTLTSLLIAAVIGLGTVVFLLIVSARVAGHRFDIRTLALERIPWGVVDVCRVVILFLFFGYWLIIVESCLLDLFPVIKNDNFRMIFNSMILDLLAVVFIVNCALGQYRTRLAALGITLARCGRNIFYGIVGYLALIPVLLAIVAVTAVVINLTKYVPARQPVVELFLKEDNTRILLFSSLFTAIAGPFIEELFFRGFMYGAVKKYTGIFWATVITSAVFAGLHTNVVGFAPIFAIGVLLAYLYEQTGTLVSSITVHMIHNLAMVAFVFLIKQLQV